MGGWTELTLVAAFLAGLTGSVHCAAMCGPLLGIACRSGASNSKSLHWLSRTIAYNAGRITSYTIAGALTGALGAGGLAFRAGPVAQQIVLMAMSAALLVLAAYVAGWTRLAHVIEAAGSVIWRRIEPYSRIFLPADTPARAFGLGLAWGWLPCGMVYVALIAALATADPLHGALLMAAFGLGTLPSLIAVAAGGSFLARAAKSRVARWVTATFIGVAGMVGIVRAAQLASSEPAWCIDVPGLAQLLRTWL